MLKVGITGGIGSGKSVVCRVFQVLGIPVFSADQIGKQLVTENEKVINSIKKAFGQELYKDGKLNTKALAEMVFNKKEALDKLNGIVHPSVQQEYEKWLAQQQAPYIIKEAAILFETGKYRDLDYMLTVVAPEELKIKRVMQRDKVTKEEVLQRMQNQMSDEEKMKLSDFVIRNNEKQLVLPQVLQIHEKMIKQIKKT